MERMSRLAVCLVLALALVSCASERLIDRSGPTPDWVTSMPEPTATELHFRGQALGRNILDEAAMRNQAMMDVRQQVAATLGTSVEATSEELLRKQGSAALGADRILQAQYRSEIRTTVDEEVRAVAQEAFYWEKWRVDTGLFQRAFLRYKYFVLAGYPKAEYDRNVNYFARLLAGEQRADKLMEAGKPKEAAELLEDLLNEYPKASVPVRLKLADAYEQAQMLARAEGVLEVALKLSSEPAEKARIRERIKQLAESFPDLSGNPAYVVVDFDAASGQSLDAVGAWIEESLSASHVRVLAIARGLWGRPSSQQMFETRRAGATWLVVLKLREAPGEAIRQVYGALLHEVRVECSARVVSVAEGKLLVTKSALARGLDRDRETAARSASKNALRTALRQCLLALVGSEE